jgi:integrative and conjugative element protein (TIGR02256 family)
MLEFRSDDFQYGLQIEPPQINVILDFCKRAGSMETGGILVGRYTVRHDVANVTAITGAPTDSKSGRSWFYRGVFGLQSRLEQLWYTKRHYYLGEWHFHPGSEPYPSQIDMKQMIGIARSPRYHCPEPVLIIVGLDPGRMSLTDCIRAYVFNAQSIMWELSWKSKNDIPDSEHDG